MNINKIINLLLLSPNIPQPYRLLHEYFLSQGMKVEADAMHDLVEKMNADHKSSD